MFSHVAVIRYAAGFFDATCSSSKGFFRDVSTTYDISTIGSHEPHSLSAAPLSIKPPYQLLRDIFSAVDTPERPRAALGDAISDSASQVVSSSKG